MPGQNLRRNDVDQFLQNHIDTVPHLEAFLLLWNTHPRDWSVKDMAEGLFVTPESAKTILEDLTRQGLIVLIPGFPEVFRYKIEPGRDELVALIDVTYRRELIRISTLIHSKPSAAVREFAKAFRLTKDRE